MSDENTRKWSLWERIKWWWWDNFGRKRVKKKMDKDLKRGFD